MIDTIRLEPENPRKFTENFERYAVGSKGISAPLRQNCSMGSIPIETTYNMFGATVITLHSVKDKGQIYELEVTGEDEARKVVKSELESATGVGLEASG